MPAVMESREELGKRDLFVVHMEVYTFPDLVIPIFTDETIEVEFLAKCFEHLAVNDLSDKYTYDDVFEPSSR